MSNGPRDLLAAFAAAVMALSPQIPAKAAELSAGPGRGETGAVDTLAGPGYCKQGASVLDKASRTVRTLATGKTGPGAFYVETGPPGEGLIARIGAPEDVSFPAKVLRTGIKLSRRPAGSGPSTSRRSAMPIPLAADNSGGAFAGAGAKLLRITGGVSTVAGNPAAPHGAPGNSAAGDGGPRLAAKFKFILSVTADDNGNAYVADEIDAGQATFRIRFVNLGAEPVSFFGDTESQIIVTPGSVDTILGPPMEAATRAPAAKQAANLAGEAPALAWAPGRLYLAVHRPGKDSAPATSRVAMVNLSAKTITAHGVSARPGAIVTVAGDRSGGSSGAGRTPGTVSAISADAGGNVYLAQRSHHRVLKLDPAGRMSVFAGAKGSGRSPGGFNGNERPAAGALLNLPADVDAGPHGRIYISDQLNGQVRFVDTAGLIHAAPGNGIGLSHRCQTPGSDGPSGGFPVLPDSPQTVAADPAGGIYFTTKEGGRLNKLSSNGLMTTVLGRVHTGTIDTEINGLGIVYTVEPGRVRVFNPTQSGTRIHGVTVAAGRSAVVAGERAFGGRGQPARGEDGGPKDVTVGRQGSLFIAYGRRGVLELDSKGKLTTLLPGASPDEARCCAAAVGVAADRSGNLYVLEERTAESAILRAPRIWFINLAAGPVLLRGKTVAPGGSALIAGQGSGILEPPPPEVVEKGLPTDDIHLIYPTAIAVDQKSNVYVLQRDSGPVAESIVLKITPQGQVGIVAGAGGGRAFNGDGLPGRLTALSSNDIALDDCGNLLVADAANQRVRRLNLSERCTGPQGAASAPDDIPAQAPAPGKRALPWVVGTLGVLLAAMGLSIVYIRKR